MNVTVEVDSELLDHAAKLGGQKTPQDVVSLALEEFIRRRSKVAELINMAGTVQFHDGYDYKALRAGRYDNP